MGIIKDDWEEEEKDHPVEKVRTKKIKIKIEVEVEVQKIEGTILEVAIISEITSFNKIERMRIMIL
jgi:hypothetical protein